MDIAIDGEGFIELLGPAGQGLLWRGGQLTVNRDGYLAASDGLPLRDLISVPIGAASVTITPDGTVMAQIDENGETERLGKIDLVLAKDKGALEAFGAGYFLSADEQNLINAAPDEAGAGRLVQGSLEGANVELTDEMVSLLLMQRAYSANAQVVQAGDQLMSILNNLRR
jgi:flagellar basal-body rod protein FlgG